MTFPHAQLGDIERKVVTMWIVDRRQRREGGLHTVSQLVQCIFLETLALCCVLCAVLGPRRQKISMGFVLQELGACEGIFCRGNVEVSKRYWFNH